MKKIFCKSCHNLSEVNNKFDIHKNTCPKCNKNENIVIYNEANPLTAAQQAKIILKKL